MPAVTSLPRPGLTGAEAAARFARYGPNEIREEGRHPVRMLLARFWSPVAWMLEASVALEALLGHAAQALIISALLVVNAAIGFFEENGTQRALAALRQRLVIRVRVLRDGEWRDLQARELVPGDVIRIRVGDVTPADCRIQDGSLLEDRSVLTGESVPVEVGGGGIAYAGTTIQRGEATAEVTQTGTATFFGKSAELVRTAAPVAHVESVVGKIAKALVALDALVIGAVLVKASITGLQVREILPFTLLLMVASIPVALPATFTLASALGSQQLAARGVLVARLAAVEEAAALDVLCCDKTGTLTENRLTVTAVRTYPPEGREAALALAAMASDAATRDPIDLAIVSAAGNVSPAEWSRLAFVPFDPSTKRSEAIVLHEGGELRVVKGAPPVVASLAEPPAGFAADVEALAASGSRVLALAAGPAGRLQVVSLIGLSDPPRTTSRQVVERLHSLGVRTVLVTGDGLPTARAVAEQVGIRGEAMTSAELRRRDGEIGGAQIIAEVFPEDKSRIVRALQREGHVVGMTGDGVNDAPALRQAEVGVAVSHAADVARAAAGVVLTEEGLKGVVDTVDVGRRINQRILSYAQNKIVKTIQAILFLGGSFVAAGLLAVSPLQIVLLLLLNDFVTMSLATDRVATIPDAPQRWNLRALVGHALLVAIAWVLFSAAAVVLGSRVLHLDPPRLQTLAFVVLVFTGQATVYLVREHGHFWQAMPSPLLAASSAFALVATAVLATSGWCMPSLSPGLVGAVALAAAGQLLGLDLLKVAVRAGASAA